MIQGDNYMQKRKLLLVFLPASLLFGSFLAINSVKEFKPAKADGGNLTLHFTDFYGNGNRNVLDLRNVNENNIAVGWDVDPIVQVSADAFAINDNQTIGDGMVKIQKTANFKYELCIDAINWGAYNYTEGSHEGAKCIKEGDIITVGGSWATASGWNVTVSPFSAQWSNGAWAFITNSSASINTSFNKVEQNNQNGFYINAKVTNSAPVVDWNTRFIQVSDDAVLLNGEPTATVSGNSKGRLTKVGPNRYYFGLNDINYSTLQNNRQVDDEVVLQGTWRYNESPSNYVDIVVDPLRVKWDGSAWVNVPYTMVELDLTYSNGNAKEIDLVSATEDAIPYNDNWSERLVQSSAACISINGVEKSGCPMIKVGVKTYIFYLGDIPNYTDAVDGVVVIIKGVWQYTLGLNANVKEISLTFNGSAWLKTFVYNALKALDEYKATIDMTLYSEANQGEINSIINAAKDSIMAAADQAAADAIVQQAKADIANVKTIAQELAEAKVAAKAELEAYKNPNDYREAEQQQLAQIVADGKDAIDAATDKTGVAAALAAAKAQLDALKTKAQYEAEEAAAAALAAAKEAAVEEINTYYNQLLANKKYDEAGKAALLEAKNAALAAIEAAQTEEAVTAAVTSGKAAMDAVEEYVEPEPETSESEEEQPSNKGGCGGSIIATGAILSMMALAGVTALVIKKRKQD